MPNRVVMDIKLSDVDGRVFVITKSESQSKYMEETLILVSLNVLTHYKMIDYQYTVGISTCHSFSLSAL